MPFKTWRLWKKRNEIIKRVKPKIDLNVLFTVLLSRFPSFVNISLYLFKTSKVAAVILLCYMTLQCKQNKMFLIIPISHRRQLQPPNLPIFISIDIKSLVFVSNFKYSSNKTFVIIFYYLHIMPLEFSRCL